MGLFLMIVGIFWSIIGALNLLTIWQNSPPFGSESMSEVGGIILTTTFSAYFFPGLVLAALGVIIRNQIAGLNQRRGAETIAKRQHDLVNSHEAKNHTNPIVDQTTISSYPGAKYFIIGVIVLCAAAFLYSVFSRQS